MQAIQALTRDKTIIMIAHRSRRLSIQIRFWCWIKGRIVRARQTPRHWPNKGIYSKFIQEKKNSRQLADKYMRLKKYLS